MQKNHSPTHISMRKSFEPYLKTLSFKGQLVIPRSLRQALGSRLGDKLLLEVQGDTLCGTHLRRSIAEAMAGSLAPFVPKDKLGEPWEEIIATTKQLTAAELAIEGCEEEVTNC